MSVETKAGDQSGLFSDEQFRMDRPAAEQSPIRGLVKCPIRFSLDLLAGKWRLPVICSLMEARTLRWGQLKRRLGGVTNTMLAGALADLQAAGLVSRTQYNEMPLRVEYALTEIGHSLAPILRRLGEWGLTALTQNGTEGLPAAGLQGPVEGEEPIREAG